MRQASSYLNQLTREGFILRSARYKYKEHRDEHRRGQGQRYHEYLPKETAN